ncbi:ketopantoate reductase family protein [Corticibacter populi]|uniref:2-dehydropantoate 2-reductase n=1 Tax=Corticibacter populi TaxID=1550736 RepID=A0A3M6QTP2_9BURK|nr:ketopantoate reductase family protein [Corticibacter populi]RMX06390.1 ketopantoate reductase family protein [Corticibacter populi]RZS32064.1 ketopantoate reductase [Corticibacter populi]
MRIGVMGAGAVGCYYGALLARAGHAVTLIGRPALVTVVRQEGLRLQRADLDVQVAMQASQEPAALADAELVLFCVKSSDSEAAARALEDTLAPQAVVLSLQNGVDNPERIRAILPNPVVPAVVYVATEMAGPGHVLHHGRGELIAGPWEGCDAAQTQFAEAGIPLAIDAEVVQRQWQKLIINCAYNALSAVAQVNYGQLVQTEGVARLMQDVVDECLAVAAAQGLALTHPGMDAVLGLARGMAGQHSSTAQDLARGKPTEIEYINGHIVRLGERLGVATPANRALLVMVRVLENKAVH